MTLEWPPVLPPTSGSFHAPPREFLAAPAYAPEPTMPTWAEVLIGRGCALALFGVVAELAIPVGP